ncbi:phosphonate C-P lyase system protein PhnH [Mesorhizobium sp. BAC0120]|uniref:phosphonate C-P lyase system protein PhnH n=1 Tax=Mesorhizobium sp. BAC0120 TaxID=3090670 RepID=UPI00298BF694|nr:phosphonate C-P lyase system protein PhnH [Mesorhizobium sp. BAC0120]MDW6025561.1 phosphonate C-P lyase system protein PhnH [Mesorhizobium sp. BAC0120]
MFGQADTIEGGFANPVFDAQAVFKAVMDAMARPGTVMPVKALASPPEPLSATAAAVALTLCDHDTPLWLDSQLAASAAVYSWLGFHTGAPLVEVPAQAAFALAASPGRLPPLGNFGRGSQEYPDRSTTIVLQVDALSSDAGAAPHPYPLPVKDGEREASTLVPPSPRLRGEGKGEGQRRLVLEGPGIQTTTTLLAAPLPANFIEQWQENRARFPRGVDLILAAPGAVACLPRTVRIEPES